MAAAINFNLTQCAINARSAFLQTASNLLLVQQDGSYTSNLANAWGIRYEACNRLCGLPGTWSSFDWSSRKLSLALDMLVKAQAKAAGFKNALDALSPSEQTKVNKCFAANKHDLRRLLDIKAPDNDNNKGKENLDVAAGPKADLDDPIPFVTYNCTQMCQNREILKESRTKVLLPLKSFRTVDKRVIPGFPKNGQAILNMDLGQINAVLYHLVVEPQMDVKKERARLVEEIARS